MEGALATRSSTHAGGAAFVRAAVAEAHHVDGYYRLAADEWMSLADDGYQLHESALKAGVALLSAGDLSGLAWFETARAAGLADEEFIYAKAQQAASTRSWSQAVALLTEATAISDRGYLRTALGVAHLRRGSASTARDLFTEALGGPRSDPLAGVNLVSLDLAEGQRSASALEWLSAAAGAHPNRPEPHVLLARLARRGQAQADPALALARARLRTRRLGLPPPRVEGLNLSEPGGLGPALKNLLGDGKWSDLARFLADAPDIGGYAALAVASYLNGACLTWLENERYHLGAAPQVTARRASETTVIECGIAVFETPTTFIATSTGCRSRTLKLDLRLGYAELALPGEQTLDVAEVQA